MSWQTLQEKWGKESLTAWSSNNKRVQNIGLLDIVEKAKKANLRWYG